MYFIYLPLKPMKERVSSLRVQLNLVQISFTFQRMLHASAAYETLEDYVAVLCGPNCKVAKCAHECMI